MEYVKRKSYPKSLRTSQNSQNNKTSKTRLGNRSASQCLKKAIEIVDGTLKSFYALNFKIHYFSFYQTKPYHKYLNVNLNENQMKEFANKITDKQKRVLFIPDQRQHDNYVSSLFISK